MSLRLTQFFQNRRLFIDALALLFGIGGFIGTTSIGMQLPLLINNAPEGWRLPAHLAIVIEFGNIGGILYSIYAKYTSRSSDYLLIYGLLFGASAVMFGLACFHQETSYIFGAERSTAILGFAFAVSLVSCTEPILCTPYMKNFRDVYLASYLVGIGLSGFFASGLALIQGVGGHPQCVNATDPNSETPFVELYPDPKFSTTAFFAIVGVIFFLSFVAFVALNNVPANSTERVNSLNTDKASSADVETPVIGKKELEWKMSQNTYIYLLVITGMLSAFEYGTYSSILTYSALPYGNVTYHLALTLGWMASPLAICIGAVFKNYRIDVISYLTAGIIALLAFVSYLAVMSPAPPLQHTWTGEIIVVLVWIALYGLTGFVRFSILILFRSDPGMGLYHTGVATIVGSTSGAVVTLCLVEFSGIFMTYSPCDDYVAL